MYSGEHKNIDYLIRVSIEIESTNIWFVIEREGDIIRLNEW